MSRRGRDRADSKLRYFLEQRCEEKLQWPTNHIQTLSDVVGLSTPPNFPSDPERAGVPGKRSDLTNVPLCRGCVPGTAAAPSAPAAAGRSGPGPWKWFGTLVPLSWWYQDSGLLCTEGQQPSVCTQTYWVRQTERLVCGCSSERYRCPLQRADAEAALWDPVKWQKQIIAQKRWFKRWYDRHQSHLNGTAGTNVIVLNIIIFIIYENI